MSSIVLDIYNDLKINDQHQLDIKIAPTSSLEIKSDGLYSYTPDGNPAPSGSNGYNVFNDFEGIRIGFNNPFDDTRESGKVLATPIVHHLYDSSTPNGSPLINFRPNIDYVFPGDMYRYRNGEVYDYYIIKTVDGYECNPGNRVTSSELLGSW